MTSGKRPTLALLLAGAFLASPLSAAALPGTPSPSPSPFAPTPLDSLLSSSAGGGPQDGVTSLLQAALQDQREVLKGKADALAEEFQKATSAYEQAEERRKAHEAALKKLEATIRAKEKEEKEARAAMESYAVAAYTNGISPLPPSLDALLRGDMQQASEESYYLESLTGAEKKRAEEALQKVQELAALRAEALVKRTALQREEERLKGEKDALSKQLREIQRLYASIGGVSPQEDPGVKGELQEQGLALWASYEAAMKEAGVNPPPRALLNDPKRWPKTWKPVVDAEKRVQPGVALLNEVGKKPVLLLSRETIEGVKVGFKALGTPYSWGGGTPSGPSYGIDQGANTLGYDCSGLMVRIWGSQGLPMASEARVASAQQVRYRKVPNASILPGDLLFMGAPAHHVTLYLGEGLMLEAPHTGSFVKVSPLRTYTSAARPSYQEPSSAKGPSAKSSSTSSQKAPRTSPQEGPQAPPPSSR